MRNEKQICGNCDYFQEREPLTRSKIGDFRKGDCHINPPVAVQKGCFPKVFFIDWCGQWDGEVEDE